MNRPMLSRPATPRPAVCANDAPASTPAPPGSSPDHLGAALPGLWLAAYTAPRQKKLADEANDWPGII